MEVIVKPSDVVDITGTHEKKVDRAALERDLIASYLKGELTQGQVGKALGFGSYWETEAFFKERQVPLPYGADDLAEDLKAIEHLGS